MMNADDEGDEEILLDRRNLVQAATTTNLFSSSGSILVGIHRFTVRRKEISNSFAKNKHILAGFTCICLGMFTGLVGPTLPFLARSLSLELSSLIWLITIKGLGFLLGMCLSFYLYHWFNVCCLLGLSCLSLSVAVCLLPFTTDLTSFYLTSLILGIGLAVSYQGVVAFYNLLCVRCSLASIRWLHLLVAFGGILSTLLLLPASLATNHQNVLVTTNRSDVSRVRREINPNNSTQSLRLTESNFTSTCIQSYCCYHAGDSGKKHPDDPFICPTNAPEQPDDCSDILANCSSVCVLEEKNIRCRMDRICNNQSQSNCSIAAIDAAVNAGKYSNGILSTSIELLRITTATSARSIHRNKPDNAISSKDDVSTNIFEMKIRSITLTHAVYLFLALGFVFLAIFYSILAIRGENSHAQTQVNVNPLALLIVTSPDTLKCSPDELPPLSVVVILIVFYFILIGMESSLTYLTYLFAIQRKFSETSSLILQCCYLFGRFIDISVNYSEIFLKKCLKKRSELISMKVSILIRLILLFLLCFSNLFQPYLPTMMFYVVFVSFGFLLSSISRLILRWIERDFNSNPSFFRWISFTILFSEMICPISLFSKIERMISVYFTIASGLLIILFIISLYRGKNWQTNRSYRLLPTSTATDDMELQQENSDQENDVNIDFVEVNSR